MNYPTLLMQAAENGSRRVLWMMGQIRAHVPPQNVISYSQQVQLYLFLLTNPDAMAALAMTKDPDEFAAWQDEMRKLTGIVGMAAINVQPDVDESDKQELEDSVQAMVMGNQGPDESGGGEPPDTGDTDGLPG